MGLARNFKWLWAGQTISLVGSAVSRLAIPTTAIFSLHASAFEVGALGAATFVAFPVLGVFAGVWVDRWPRRRLMIACDFVRALALGTLPLAAALHALTLVQLFIVAIVTSVASVFFDIAYQAYLPDVVDADSLHDANARLEASSSGAQIAGNAAAGALIASLGAALTITIDAASFGLSIVSLACIRDRPRERSVAKIAIPFVHQLRDGLDYVFSNRALLRIVLCTATSNLGGSMVGAVYLLFAYRTLHFTPTLVGLILAVGNAGFVGAFFAPRIVKRFGLPITLVSNMGVVALAQFLVPLSVRGCADLQYSAGELAPSGRTTRTRWAHERDGTHDCVGNVADRGTHRRGARDENWDRADARQRGIRISVGRRVALASRRARDRQIRHVIAGRARRVSRRRAG